METISYLQLMMSKFPTWSKIYRDKRSTGAQFLEPIANQLEEMSSYLGYVEDQLYLTSSDVSQTDILYKVNYPKNIIGQDRVTLSTEGTIVIEEKSLYKFLQNEKVSGSYNSLQKRMDYYQDENGDLFFREPLREQPNSPYGKVMIKIYNEDNIAIFQGYANLELYTIWNTFDEFALLFGLERQLGETNKELKTRILNMFKRVSNATREGLMNDIANTLGFIEEEQWVDPSKPLTLHQSDIVINSIQVNDQPYNDVSYDYSGRVVLSQSDKIKENSSVTFIAGLKVHELSDDSDKELKNDLYLVSGEATSFLHRIVKEIESRSPIYWGQWSWDESFWQSTQESENKFLPTTYDASISGWYKQSKK